MPHPDTLEISPSVPADTLAADTLSGPRQGQGESPLVHPLGEPDSLPLYQTATRAGLGGHAGRPVSGEAFDEASASLTALGLLVTFSVAAGSWRYLRQTLESLRHATFMRSGAFDEESEQRVMLAWLLVPVLGMAAGLLLARWTLSARPDVFALAGPGFLGAAGAALALALVGLRHLLQRLAGYLFFTPSQRRRWDRLQSLALLLADTLLLAAAAASLHFGLDARGTALAAWAAALLTQGLFALRARVIFFDYPGGFVHLFLYFCTTEIAPLAAAASLLHPALGALRAQIFSPLV